MSPFVNTLRHLRTDIRGHALPMLLVQPLFMIPFTMINIYASLYMKELGLSYAQIGLLTTICLASQTAGAIFAGHFADRFGRRRTVLIFDLLGWSLATLIWAGAQNFWYFFAAALITGFQPISLTSWFCWLVEDADPPQRMTLFTVVYLGTPLASFFTPLAGLLIGAKGMIAGTRLLYLIACASMTTMFIVRHLMTTESKVGCARQEETGEFRLLDSITDYKKAFAHLAAAPVAVGFFLLTTIHSFRNYLTAPFLQPYLVERLHLSKEVLAYFPPIGGAITVFIVLFALPWLKTRDRWGMLWGFMLTAVSFTILLLATPKGNLVSGALVTLLFTAGTAILPAAMDTGWYNSLGAAERAKVVSMATLAANLVRIPSGYLAGWLYEQSAGAPFLLSLGLIVLSLLIMFFIPRSTLKAPIETLGINTRSAAAGD